VLDAAEEISAVVVVSSAVSLERFSGRTLVDRHIEALRRAGVTRVTVGAPAILAADVRASLAADDRRVEVAAGESLPAPEGAPPRFRVVVCAERVFDTRLYEAAVAARAPAAMLARGRPIGLDVVSPDPHQPRADLHVEDMDPYSRELRRAVPPSWMRVSSIADRAAVRAMLIAASGKGHLEVVAHVLHRPIEAAIMQRLAETRLSPNHITLLCNVVAYAGAALLATGHLAAGTLAAMAVGVIDGLDGRQARVQLRTSAFGAVEHVFDKIYEILWIAALTYAVSSGFEIDGYAKGLIWWIAAYLADTAAYDVFKLCSGIRLDEASPTDAAIRMIAGRRNIYTYMLLAGVIARQPAAAYWAIVWWAAVTAIVHWMRVTYLLTRMWPASPRTACDGPARK